MTALDVNVSALPGRSPSNLGVIGPGMSRLETLIHPSGRVTKCGRLIISLRSAAAAYFPALEISRRSVPESMPALVLGGTQRSSTGPGRR